MNAAEVFNATMSMRIVESIVRGLPDLRQVLELVEAREMETERAGRKLPAGLDNRKALLEAFCELQKVINALDELERQTAAKPPEVKIEV